MRHGLRIALVGCGAHAGVHVQGLLAARDRLQVVATCDVDGARAAARAAELGVARSCSSYEELLGAADVDAVLLCLPHDQHAPAAVAAARAGKHVLVEKPIARTLAEADAMIDAARAAGITLMVAHNQRYLPLHRCVRALLDDDVIGRIHCARADNTMDFRPPADHFIRRRAPAGGGALIGYGVHRLDLLRWLVGEVVEVSSLHATAPERFEGEAVAGLLLRFAGGAVGELLVNWVATGAPWMDMLCLYGERGTVHNLGGLFVGRGGGVEPVGVPTGDPFEIQLRHFADCVRSSQTPLTSGDEGRRTLEVVLAAYRSAESGQTVRLPLAGRT